jgi:glycerol-3-phosphate dehydrogenase (NAD(P)+)
MNVTILGAGAWGTALAVQAAPRHAVQLWARDGGHASAMAEARCNHRYLDGVAWPPALAVTGDLGTALAHAADGLVVIATPMSGLRAMLTSVPDDARVLWVCKGFEAGSGLLGHEIAHELRPHAHAGVLSGPSFALEVARGQPTALVAASADDALRQAATDTFHTDLLRIYTSADAVGVEVGGAVKNVMAIATGICDALELGHNARAALITRGLAEITRFGVALGAQAQTFMGLTGVGDLILTCTGELSRNRQVGLMLGRGLPLKEALDRLGHVAEGVWSAAAVRSRAASLGVRMPITEAVCAVLEERASPRQALDGLLARQPRREGPE